jgi:SAM-dependent methyltransferase
MPFKDNTFDLAYSVSILEHIPDFPRALQEVSRVLKPGGIFVLTFDISITPGQDISVNEVGSLFGRILSSGFAEVRHPDAKFVTMKQLRYDAIGDRFGLFGVYFFSLTTPESEYVRFVVLKYRGGGAHFICK